MREPIDISPRHDVDYKLLVPPDLATVLDESAWWAPYRDYSPGHFGASWKDAAACLEWERRLLSRLQNLSPDGEDALLDQLDDEGECDWPCEGLDLGVGAAVLGLSAAGCATLISCSGHFGQGRWINYPMIQFAADVSRARILVPIARNTHCSITNAFSGLEVWAESIDPMLAFAEALIEQRDSFADLPAAIVEPSEHEGNDPMITVIPDQGLLF